MKFRAIVVVCAAALLGVQVVRNAAVQAYAPTKPSQASRFWSGHPATELSLGMTQIAEASRRGQPIPPTAFALITDAAVKEPLAAEPFLVRGVQAQLGGNDAAAQRAFEAAQWRDPRSLPAAYFLADRYFRTGNRAGGLREVAALARLAPSGNVTVAPYLASYAADPSNWPALRQLFQSHPGLADPTLTRLASDISTVPAALALADPREKADDAHWLVPLLSTLVNAGRYDQAHRIWARFSGPRARSGELVHDAGFSDKVSPAPFNWSLTSSTVGLAERQRGGRLHVIFYGQEDGILASQLLQLSPGTYRLSLRLLGDAARAKALAWSLWCDKADAPISSATLDNVAADGWTFTVPPACPAQWLRLSGSSSDVSQQSDVSITGLKLQQVTPHA